MKTDAQKVHCDIVSEFIGNSSGLQPSRIIEMYLYLISRQVVKGKLIQILKINLSLLLCESCLIDAMWYFCSNRRVKKINN